MVTVLVGVIVYQLIQMFTAIKTVHGLQVYLIFGRIASVFSQALTETFDSLQHPGLLPPPQATHSILRTAPLAQGEFERGLRVIKWCPGLLPTPQPTHSILRAAPLAQVA